MSVDKKSYKTQELELPETLYVRGIDDDLFKEIVLECLLEIDAIALPVGNFFYSLFQRPASDAQKWISIKQNGKDHSVSVRVEINICRGEAIPIKSEEIQTKICQDITKTTGLHVSSVHIVFKKTISFEEAQQTNQAIRESMDATWQTPIDKDL